MGRGSPDNIIDRNARIAELCSRMGLLAPARRTGCASGSRHRIEALPEVCAAAHPDAGNRRGRGLSSSPVSKALS